MKKTRSKKPGKIIPNGVKPESHEVDLFLLLANVGKTIELIMPSNTPHSRRPDFVMDGVEWEAKSPKFGARRTLERSFYDASNQSSNIIDLRQIKEDDGVAIAVLEKCFRGTRRVRRMYIVTKTWKLKFYKK